MRVHRAWCYRPSLSGPMPPRLAESPSADSLQAYQWLQVAVPVPLRKCFDYRMPTDTKVCVGQRVVVPFGRRRLVGIALGGSNETSLAQARIKDVVAVLDTAALPAELLALLSWAADYYHHPIGEALTPALPPALRKVPKRLPAQQPAKKRQTPEQKALGQQKLRQSLAAAPAPPPTPSQARAQQIIAAALGGYQCFLLEGATGSGKTEVYMQLVCDCLERREQVLILVPEISLTPAFCERFEARFPGQISVMHSGLTEAQRRDRWLALAEGEVELLLGTRIALFTPMPRLGLIVVDEEQDSAYKQPSEFCYSARDLAVKRASICDIPVVLGSATPSLETIANIEKGRYTAVQLATGERPNQSQPRWSLVDLRPHPANTLLAPKTIASMHEHLQQGHQVLFFINRRGYAPVLFCPSCRYTLDCSHCDARMVIHTAASGDDFALCHHCASRQSPPAVCPTCGQETFIQLGAGTQKFVDWMAKHFTDFETLRFDTDISIAERMRLLARVQSGHGQILVGTQMLAKGHDLEHLTLTVVADADSGLLSADFRAAERTAQLIVQVAGRSGRHRSGEVLIQTRCPQHSIIQTLLHKGYATFAQSALRERRTSRLPPYTYLALFRAEAKNEAATRVLLESLATTARTFCRAQRRSDLAQAEIWGPAPAPMKRKAGHYRYQLVLCTTTRSALKELVALLITQLEAAQGTHPGSKGVRWFVEIDPQQVY